MQFGQGTFTITAALEYECKSFAFNPAYKSGSDVRVQLGLHEKDANPTYEAAVSWVEKVTVNGFQACVATSGPIAGSRLVSLQWMAFLGEPSGGLAGIQAVVLWTTGTKCKDVYFVGKVWYAFVCLFVCLRGKCRANLKYNLSKWSIFLLR